MNYIAFLYSFIVFAVLSYLVWTVSRKVTESEERLVDLIKSYHSIALQPLEEPPSSRPPLWFQAFFDPAVVTEFCPSCGKPNGKTHTDI